MCKSLISRKNQNYSVKVGIKEHVLSVFNNWDAMSLLDSFTIHAFQAEEFQLLLWRREFFRMIYIQSLFQKFYLQSLNLRFRKIMGCRNEKELEVLLHEFEHYERICHFNKISYAFLPLLIDESIDTALEIKEERAMLTEHIKREQTLHKSVNDKRGNRLLAVISALAAFSAIWDLSCLINEVFPYEQVFCCSRVGYAVMSGLFLLILVIILFVVSIMKKRNEV